MTSAAWASSNRRSRLPAGWAGIRRAVLKRDRGFCRIQGPDCTRVATEVDHVVAGDDHRMSNLQAACHACHEDKTIAERPRPTPRKRATERHPGMI